MYELLKTEYREKAPVKKMRHEGWVPGVLFGKGFDSVSFMVKKTELTKFLHHSGKVFEVEVKGHGKHLVSLDAIQKDHMGDRFQHVSFHKISASEKITVKLPVHFVGEAVGTKHGGIVQPVLSEIEVKGLPKDMPEFLEFDISELDVHGHFALSHFKAPKGLEWAHDVEANVISCHPPKKVEEPVEETPAAEVEVISEAPVEEEIKEAA